MSDLRVLMLTNAVSPDQLGGLQRYVRELAGALSRKDVEVSVVTRRVNADDPARELGSDGVRLHRYDVAPRSDSLYFARYPLAAIASAWRGARRHGPGGIAHVHYSLPGVALALGGLPFVQTFHAPAYKELVDERQGRYALPAEQPVARLLRSGERLLVRRARRIAVLSDFMRREVLTLDAGAGQRLRCIPGGLDTDRFSPGPAISHQFAETTGPLLLTARRFVPRTGVDELVRAMPALLKAIPGARLAVCGDGPLRDAIADFISQAGLGDHVRLLGRVSEEDLLGWYRRADLFVMPTQELEGFGLSAAEALATGTPVVGTCAGAVPELLGTLEPRLVSPSVDSAALARTLIDVLSDPVLVSAVAERARAHVHPGMAWPAIADRYLELYEAAL